MGRRVYSDAPDPSGEARRAAPRGNPRDLPKYLLRALSSSAKDAGRADPSRCANPEARSPVKESSYPIAERFERSPTSGAIGEFVARRNSRNPFFLEQIYRRLLDNEKIFDDTGEFRTDIDIDEIEIPDNVLLVLTRWLADLTEHEKRILAAAAVVGRSFSFQLLSALSQSNLDELFSVIHKGQQIGILVASPQGSEMWYVFTNELVRRSLLSYVSASRYRSIKSVCNQYDQSIEPGHGQLTSHSNGGPPL